VDSAVRAAALAHSVADQVRARGLTPLTVAREARVPVRTVVALFAVNAGGLTAVELEALRRWVTAQESREAAQGRVIVTLEHPSTAAG
jgi:stringent starvation protein B